MEGQGYLPYVVAITVDVATSGSGVQDVYTFLLASGLRKLKASSLKVFLLALLTLVLT